MPSENMEITAVLGADKNPMSNNEIIDFFFLNGTRVSEPESPVEHGGDSAAAAKKTPDHLLHKSKEPGE